MFPFDETITLNSLYPILNLSHYLCVAFNLRRSSLSDSISDWLLTCHLYFGTNQDQFSKYLDSVLSRNNTTILTMYLIGLEIDTAFVLTNRL